jgi:hypothetical protein
MHETGFAGAELMGPRVPIATVYNALAKSEPRNARIFDDVLTALEMRRHPLVLTERRDHLETTASNSATECSCTAQEAVGTLQPSVSVPQTACPFSSPAGPQMASSDYLDNAQAQVNRGLLFGPLRTSVRCRRQLQYVLHTS